MSYEELPVFGNGEDITGTDNDDILVGEGGNTFEGKAGDDLFVLSYEATEIFTSTIADFNIEEDAIGLINLGVTVDNFSDSITQQFTPEGDLNLSLNGNTLATLAGVGTELTSDRFYLA
ncbi:MAG: hypothetical protein AAGK10_22485 [Cyanobacteria bacterium J06555_3]